MKGKITLLSRPIKPKIKQKIRVPSRLIQIPAEAHEGRCSKPIRINVSPGRGRRGTFMWVLKAAVIPGAPVALT